MRSRRVSRGAAGSLPDADSATYMASGQDDAIGIQKGRVIFTVGSGNTNFHVHGQS